MIFIVQRNQLLINDSTHNDFKLNQINVYSTMKTKPQLLLGKNEIKLLLNNIL